MNTNLSLKPDLEDETLHEVPEINVPVRLNINKNPYPPPAVVIESIVIAVVQTVRGLNRYPERDFPRLRAVLTDYLGAESGAHLVPEQVQTANGSDKVMLYVLQASSGPGRTCLSFTPTYSMYSERACSTLTDYAIRPRRRDSTFGVDNVTNAIKGLQPAVVILASSNDPAGAAPPLGDIKRILEVVRDHSPMSGAKIGLPVRASDCVVVIDKAYAEFRRLDVPNALELVGPDNPHLVVTRTTSETFGTAGLRLNYLAVDRALIDALRMVRLPYHLSVVTQTATLAAPPHHDEPMTQVTSLRDERDVSVDWLRTQGLSAHESDANFVLSGLFPNREIVWQTLLDTGILIRVVGPESFLRTSVRTPEEMTRLRAVLILAIGR